jgi:8-oxo-dGTP diphosphatase
MADIRQRVAAKALIVNDEGKVLLVREASAYKEGTNVGRYDVPGGRIEPGEKYMDALHREVREEVGLEVEPIKPLYVSEWFPVIKGEPNHITAIFYACRALGTDAKLSEDHDDFVWVDPEKIGDYNTMDVTGNVVKAWLAERDLTQ